MQLCGIEWGRLVCHIWASYCFPWSQIWANVGKEGYKYTINKRPQGQCMPNCQAGNISDMATILCYKTIVIAEVNFVH